MKEKAFSKNLFVALYYIALIAIFMTWTNYDDVPDRSLRIGFFVLMIIPLIIRTELLPIVFTFFYSLGQYAYSSSYVPMEFLVYLLPSLFLLFFVDKSKRLIIPLILFLLLSLVTIANLLDASEIQYVTYCLILTIIYSQFIPLKDHSYLKYLLLSYVVLSVILSYYQLTVGTEYNFNVTIYGTNTEQSGFKDINYGAAVVACGIICSLIYLIVYASSLTKKLLCVASMIVCVFSLVINASRNSLLIVILAVLFLLWFAKVRSFYKILAIAIATIIVYYIYSEGFTDYLLFRIENDEGGGSERTIIWLSKLEAFLENSDFPHLLFGYGYESGRHIGFDNAAHNDFVAFLLAYGFVGLSLFLAFFFYPLVKMVYNKKYVILIYIALFLCSMTLEPLNAGRLPFYIMWLMALYIGQVQITPNDYEQKKSFIG